MRAISQGGDVTKSCPRLGTVAVAAGQVKGIFPDARAFCVAGKACSRRFFPCCVVRSGYLLALGFAKTVRLWRLREVRLVVNGLPLPSSPVPVLIFL